VNLLSQIELDSSTYFSGEDFATTLTYQGGSIWCLFDRQWLAVDGEYSDTSTVQPTAMIHQADAPNLAVGDTVTIGGTDYTVRDSQPDRGETGDVLLVLST
jgi:hypothetical protein